MPGTVCPNGHQSKTAVAFCPVCGAAMLAPAARPKKKTSFGIVLLVIAGVILFCVFIGISAGNAGKKTQANAASTGTAEAVAIANRPTATVDLTATAIALTPSATPSTTPIPTDTNTPEPSKTPTETYTPAPTDTPLPPTATLSPLDALKTNIAVVLGKGNRDIPKLNSVEFDGDMLAIDFAVDDNLTENLIIYGSKMDIVDILKAVHDNGFEYNSVLVAGKFAMQDKYGNAGETQVIGCIYNKSTVDKINWDNFLTDDIYTIKDGGFVSPAFQP